MVVSSSSSVNETKDDSDPLETVLTHIGEMGLYQKLLFFFMAPFGFIFAFVYFGQMFIAATPQQHWCHVSELGHLDLELRRNLSIPPADAEWPWERCTVYQANWSQVLETMKPPPAGSPTVQCRDGWDFLLNDIPYHTVVSERGWVCSRSSFAPLAQSIFFGGSLFGGLLFGWLADSYGRVPALIGSNVMAGVGNLATIYTGGLWDFSFARFLCGMAYDSCFMMIYILVLEYVGPRHRTIVANLSIALFFGSACIALPWLALWAADWRRLLLLITAPVLMVVLVPWTVPESARWLASKGKVNRAVAVLKKFEKVNRTHIPQEALDEFVVACRQTSKTDESIKALILSPPLRLMMGFLIVVYMACALIFDGLVRMSESMGMDFFITFTLTSATEIPSVILLAFILDWFGRKKLTVGPIWIAGILSLVAAFVPKGLPQVVLAVLARFFINMSYNAAIQWATELLPTGVRASGSSVVHVSGYIATVVSPFIVYTEQYWHGLPLFLLGLIALVAGSTGLFLPETMGRPMPQTIADGERLYLENTWFGKRLKPSNIENQEEEKLKSDKEKALIA